MDLDKTGEALASSAGSFGWIVSLAFWLSLFLAAFCLATVALAPKLLVYSALRSEYMRNQARLVALEQQVAHLERVQGALENDPDFAAELARADLGASRPGDERIPVGPPLSLDAALSPSPAEAARKLRAAWYSPLLETLAGHRTVRAVLLIFASAVTLAAFILLDESRLSKRERHFNGSGRCDRSTNFWSVAAIARRLIDRYRKPPDDR